MAPDALQAKAAALVEQVGIGQTELMVRTFAASQGGDHPGSRQEQRRREHALARLAIPSET